MDNYTNSTANTTLSSDPYLAFLPSLARSLPVQATMLGSILTFFFSLLIHLLLTSPYHMPLSKLNWSLQVSAVLAAMLSLSARIGLVLHNSLARGMQWPYMLDYVEVDLPADGWQVAESAAWYMLEAVVVGLVHITNIQFLSLLFPSTVEVRMICGMLVPLAVLASGMNFASLSSDQPTIDLGDAIRNVCNSTLMLLFAAALAIWGWLNRRRAWRTDGGTAAFGTGAIFLAILGAAIGFALIKVDNVQWLTCLGWAVTLWQSFLAWWWWVGSGMGIGEVEELLRTQYPGFQVSVSGSQAHLSRSSSTRSLRQRSSGLTFLRNRLRRRSEPGRESDDPDPALSSSATSPNLSDEGVRANPPPHVRPHAPQLLTHPALSFLLPLYQRLRTAHLRARVIQFEQSGLWGFGAHGNWWGWGFRRPRGPGGGLGGGGGGGDESFSTGGDHEGRAHRDRGGGRGGEEEGMEMSALGYSDARGEGYGLSQDGRGEFSDPGRAGYEGMDMDMGDSGGEVGESTGTDLGAVSALSITPDDERRQRRERRERTRGSGRRAGREGVEDDVREERERGAGERRPGKWRRHDRTVY